MLNSNSIEVFIWKYISRHNVFTLPNIIIYYLKKEYGLFPSISRRNKEDHENYKDIRNELKRQFKAILDKIESEKIINKTSYSDKIYKVEQSK